MSEFKEPTFEMTFMTLFRRMMNEELYTAFPGEVKSFDGESAEIIPMVTRKYNDGSELNLPVIGNVPVMMPRTAKAIIKLPVSKGDTGLVICSKTSIDGWIVNGKSKSIQSVKRQFQLSDSVFIPGLFPFGNSLSSNTTDLEIIFGSSKIVMKEDGEINMNEGHLVVS